MSVPAVTNLEAVWASIDELAAGLDAEQWATRSLCPEWDIAATLTHIAAVEHMMSGEAPGSMTEGVPFGKIVDFMSEVDGAEPAALLAHYRAVIELRRGELAEVGTEDLDLASATPVGMKTFGRFLEVRVFDCWVHELDMRVPLGLRGNEGGPAADMAIDEIEVSLPYIIGKRVGLPDGASLTIELTGAAPREMHVAVDGRAAVVDELDAADAVLHADSTMFALLACGRIDPQLPIDEGLVSWSGNAEYGEAAARNLAFTM